MNAIGLTRRRWLLPLVFFSCTSRSPSAFLKRSSMMWLVSSSWARRKAATILPSKKEDPKSCHV
jgi:hypothetical protein